MSVWSNFKKTVARDFGNISNDLKFNLSWLTNRTIKSEILTISMTKRCNLNCTYCWDYDNRPSLKEMSTDEVKKIIESAQRLGIKTFNPFGGEPFIRKDMLEILAFGVEKGMRITLTTNGTLVTEAKTQELVKICPTGIYSTDWRFTVLVSLDGKDPEQNDRIRSKGSFEKTVRFIKTLHSERIKQQKGLAIIMNTVISRNNFHSMLDMVNLARELEVNNIHFITPVVSSDEVKKGMVEQNLFIQPADFEELDANIDAVLAIQKKDKVILNNYQSLFNFKDYYRRQYKHHEHLIKRPLQAHQEAQISQQA
jgi:MoaA/NifB/PqqE/SkfB family radical SAM enzyme